MPGIYSLLADIVLTLHFCFVLFVVGGQLLILIGWARHWVWTRLPFFRWSHLGAIGFVVVEAWLGANCPLTVLENYLRVKAGVDAYHSGFIGYWISRMLFYEAPAWVFVLLYTAFGILVVLTLFVYPPRKKVKG